ncbi:hypothetical protein ACIRST_32325 [Kitasatospora sp. NPDC101447]|uniref:hypothetical protein n=1 Tax=Kitasatospora sp. NPDC101447 TaxID=3364102 RepID=UPI003817E7B1
MNILLAHTMTALAGTTISLAAISPAPHPPTPRPAHLRDKIECPRPRMSGRWRTLPSVARLT